MTISENHIIITISEISYVLPPPPSRKRLATPCQPLVLVAVDPDNCHEGFLWYVHFSHGSHSLLSLSLLLQELFLSRDVPTIALG